VRATPARLGLSLAALLAPAAFARQAEPGALQIAYALGAKTTQRSPAVPSDSLALRLDSRFGGALLVASAERAATDTLAQAGPLPAPAPPDPAPAQDREPQPSLRDVRWGLAPIRWRGMLTTDLRHFSAEGQPSRLQQVESAQLDAASHVWQPWFAQVSAGIGGLVSTERGERGSRSTGLTGNGALSVFPTSRFPFRASFDVSDNRTSDQFLGQAYQRRRFGVRQSYRSERGDANYSASFDRSTLVSSSFGRDTVDVLAASHDRALGPHRFAANASHTRNAREGSGEHAAFTSLYGSHNFQSQERLFTLNTFVNYGASDSRLGSPGAPSEARTQVFQANSFFTWKREEDDPLYVTGGARYFQSETELGTGLTQAQQVAGFASAAYRASRNLQFNAGASVTQNFARAGGGSGLLTSQSGGVTYTTDPKRLGEFVYTANLGANASNFTGGTEGSRRFLSGQASHNLQRSYELSRAQSLSLALSQSAAASQDSAAGGQQTLSHGASASYRVTRGDSLAGFLSASASDLRSFGYNARSFQLLNLQASGQAQLGRFSSASANLTLQGTRQDTPAIPAGGFNRSINGGATYQHLQVFGVPRLRYLAVYNRNDFQFNTRLTGDLNAPREQVNSSFEQRLEYNIGKVDARLTLRFAEVDGKKNALLFFRLARQLGDW
jgi:hypothetical protein